MHLRRSKTDQTATGVTVAITATTPGDPLDAAAAWVRWRNRLASHVFHTGPAWRAIDRYGRLHHPLCLYDVFDRDRIWTVCTVAEGATPVSRSIASTTSKLGYMPGCSLLNASRVSTSAS